MGSDSIATATDRVGDPATFGPIAPNERIAELDILRGFALLGICIINIDGFFTPFLFERAGEDLYPSTIDAVAQWLVNFLGSGKFNSMFSFLFGVGFAIQMGRAGARGAPFAATYVRRLVALFAIGVAHTLLIWNGDVLHIYAIIGFLLLLVRKLSDRLLWVLAAVLLLVPIVHDTYNFARKEPDPHPPAYWRERGENQLRVYGRGDYNELLARMTKTAPPEPRPVVGEGRYWPAVRERARESVESYLESGDVFFWFIMATTMTVGFIVGRRRAFDDLEAHLPAIRRLAVRAGVVGFGLAAAFATCSSLDESGGGKPTLLGTLSSVFYSLQRPILCAFYICGIVLLSRRPGWRRAMAPLASVGRMPLTNYLMQSVIHGLIFYGYGFGLYGRVGPAVGVLVAVATYAVQVIYSNLWMARFRFGPMEWLWRTLTYGKPPAATSGP